MSQPQTHPRAAKPKVGLQAVFEQMLADLPDIEPGAVPEEAPPVSAPSVPASRPEPVSPPASAAAVPELPAVFARVLAENGRLARPVATTPALLEVDDDGSLGKRILDELERYSIPSVSQLRIAVRGGRVTFVGQVPSAYEKQLVVHFTRQVPGVVAVEDLMRVTGGPGLAAGPELPGGRRAVARPAVRAFSRPRLQLSFPFSARQLGTIAGVLLLAWAGFSYATRPASHPPTYAVTGQVLFDGVPPVGAALTLHPADRSVAVQPKATVQQDGKFQFTTYSADDGAPPGDYKLTIVWHKLQELDGEAVAGPNLLPEAFSRTATTTLHVTVADDDTEIPLIVITQPQVE